jgi:uncharacterized protein YacL
LLSIAAQIVLIAVTGVTGYFIAKEILQSAWYGLFGSVCGLVLGYLVIKLEEKLREIPLKIIVGTLIGITVGLSMANLFISKLLLTHAKDIPITLPIYILLYCVMGYLGFRIGEKKSHTLDLSRVPLFGNTEGSGEDKILDTSAIIDGRIADICETGFLDGAFVIPQFVLYEIQHIADLQDPVKKVRGRRGLEVLHKLQKQTRVKVKIVDVDFPRLKDVDSKLIALTKSLQGKIVTNDYNLSKVAELQGINVLNINELSTVLKPAILPGEHFALKVVKEGREFGQGVGYLDDGTMVVVDDAKKLIGTTTEVVVTSLLQTTSGRMVFARQKGAEESEPFFTEEYKYEEQVR